MVNKHGIRDEPLRYFLLRETHHEGLLPAALKLDDSITQREAVQVPLLIFPEQHHRGCSVDVGRLLEIEADARVRVAERSAADQVGMLVDHDDANPYLATLPEQSIHR